MPLRVADGCRRLIYYPNIRDILIGQAEYRYCSHGLKVREEKPLVTKWNYCKCQWIEDVALHRPRIVIKKVMYRKGWVERTHYYYIIY